MYGYPQIFKREGHNLISRLGIWNGLPFTGSPVEVPNLVFSTEFVVNQKEIYYKFEHLSSIVQRIVLNWDGRILKLQWIERNQEWIVYADVRVYTCGRFALCSPYGSCSMNRPPQSSFDHVYFYYSNWAWGVITLTFTFIWQIYTMNLLVNLYEDTQSGVRYNRYLQLAYAAVVCASLGCKLEILTVVKWYLVFACAIIILSQLPNLNSIAGISLLGAIAFVGYRTTIWTVSVAKDRLPNVSYNPVRIGSHVTRFFDVLNALGIIAFAFRGNNLILEVQVYIDDDSMVLMERLTGNQKQLDIILIVGMGGLGKTTLAKKVFSDRFIVYHFRVRAWVSVSQAYSKKDLLISILTSIGKQQEPEEIYKLKVGKISELLYKSLKGKRYLIVIDDLWSDKAWDDLKMYFQNDNTCSRILLTTHLSEISLYANSQGFTHYLQFLTMEESWELLSKKVFPEDDCVKRLIKAGMQIAKKCQGLPLAVVVVVGLLAKGEKTTCVWEKVAESVISYIVGDPKGYLDTLALSYDHLHPHLKNCFLYVGGFPEDCKITVTRLIWLWVAEGFIHEDGEKLLEEVAEDYLMDLYI